MAENIKTEQHYYTKDFSGYRNEEDNFVANQELTVTITLNEYRKLIEIKAVKDKEEDTYRGKYFAEERKNEKLDYKTKKITRRTKKTRRTRTMYYKIGEIKNKIISFNGFEFKVSVMKRHDGISIQIKDMNNVPLKSFHVIDLSELYIATDAMRDVINEWIEENTDEQDRLINLVMKW